MGKRNLNESECFDLLLSERVGRLSTCRDNEPYVIPVNFVFYQNKIYIHTGFKGRKIENIESNPSVCFEVDKEIRIIPSEKACKFNVEFISVIVFGIACFIRDQHQKLEVLRALTLKYSSSLEKEPLLTQADTDIVSVIVISPERISGRMSGI